MVHYWHAFVGHSAAVGRASRVDVRCVHHTSRAEVGVDSLSTRSQGTVRERVKTSCHSFVAQQHLALVAGNQTRKKEKESAEKRQSKIWHFLLHTCQTCKQRVCRAKTCKQSVLDSATVSVLSVSISVSVSLVAKNAPLLRQS